VGRRVPGGKKRSNVDYESVSVSIPRAIHDELIAIIEHDQRWFDRVEFVREAVKEKIDRWKKDHPLWTPPGKR
jgi:metal-responsive CopG/Arc/MetJ family transcriptional regulator